MLVVVRIAERLNCSLRAAQGMDNIRKFYGDYGDIGEGPEQWRIEEEGEEYMENYPLMDKFKTCKVKIVYPGNRELLSVEGKDSLTDFAYVEE